MNLTLEELRDVAQALDLRNRVELTPVAAAFATMDRRGMWACPTCTDGLLTIESPAMCRACRLERNFE